MYGCVSQTLPDTALGLGRGINRPFRWDWTLERSPRYQFYDEKVWIDIEKTADVRMIESRDGSRFPVEACAEVLVGDFDRNRPAQSRAARTEHLAPCHRGFGTRLTLS